MANIGALLHRDKLRGPVIYTFLAKLAIEYEEEKTTIGQGDQRSLILNHLNHCHLREDKAQDNKENILAQTARFCIIGSILFKRSISCPFLNCVSSTEVSIILKELHEGHARNHAGGRSLAFGAHQVGYYSPTKRIGVVKLVKKCDKCQRYANYSNLSAGTLFSITSLWPFEKWGMGIISPFPMSAHGCKDTS